MDSFVQNVFTIIGFGAELFFVETGVCIRRKDGEVTMDREKVINGINKILEETDEYDGVLWDAIALLQEQEEKTQGADSGMCEICSFYERAMPVKPVLDEQTGRIWLCGKCGSYVGFEDNDPHDPNEFDKFCRECGRPVLWERG